MFILHISKFNAKQLLHTIRKLPKTAGARISGEIAWSRDFVTSQGFSQPDFI